MQKSRSVFHFLRTPVSAGEEDVCKGLSLQQSTLIESVKSGSRILRGFEAKRRAPRACGLQRTEWPVVCAFDGKPGDDNVSCVNVFWVGDLAIREGLSPCFGPLQELIP